MTRQPRGQPAQLPVRYFVKCLDFLALFPSPPPFHLFLSQTVHADFPFEILEVELFSAALLSGLVIFPQMHYVSIREKTGLS
uniref:Ovule protein n=1 Tax=Ascaris lumbricoides TaxID=6252 RepID=A0A0M3I1N1_ASCLU